MVANSGAGDAGLFAAAAAKDAAEHGGQRVDVQLSAEFCSSGSLRAFSRKRLCACSSRRRVERPLNSSKNSAPKNCDGSG